MNNRKNSIGRIFREDTKRFFLFGITFFVILFSSNLLLINLTRSNIDQPNENETFQSFLPLPPTRSQLTIPLYNGIKDSDSDGLSDQEENLLHTDPEDADTDRDGLSDGEEVLIYFTEPTLVDTDYDFLCDGHEILITKTDPINPDCDNDDLLDGYEIMTYKSNPFDPDTDDDNLNDYQETKIFFTNVNIPDTDGDGLLDGDEVLYFNSNPLKEDTDGDKLTDYWEVINGFNPSKRDNWFRIIGFGVFIPGISLIIIIGIFVSARIQTIQIQKFDSQYNNQLTKDFSMRELYKILSSLPSKQQLTVDEVAKYVNYPVEVINNLIKGLFTDMDDEILADGEEISGCVINTHTEEHLEIITCFYCGTKFKMDLIRCPICLEEIVRCKLCNKPIGYDDHYTSCASYGIIGDETSVDGFVLVDHICDSCMLNNKYNIL